MQSLYLILGNVTELSLLREMLLFAYIVSIVIEGAQVIVSFKIVKIKQSLQEYKTELMPIVEYVQAYLP